MDAKVIEMMDRHEGFLDANEISVLTKIDYNIVRKEMEKIMGETILNKSSK